MCALKTEKVTEWIGSLCIQSSHGDIFSWSSNKLQTTMEITGNFYFHALEILSVIWLPVTRWPELSICWMGQGSLLKLDPHWRICGKGIEASNLNSPAFLLINLSSFIAGIPIFSSLQTFSQEGIWTLLFELRVIWEEAGCNPSEIKILLFLPCRQFRQWPGEVGWLVSLGEPLISCSLWVSKVYLSPKTICAEI